MVKKTVLTIVSGALGLLLAFTPSVAGATGTIVGGVLLDEVVNELPAPAVSVSSSGKSLVVWQGAAPGDAGLGCTANGGECNILGSVVEADGTTFGEPFLVSGSVETDFYYSAPSVVWNNDRNEWLVLFTSYNVEQDGVYAQRISATGELVGSAVTLPMDNATTLADRTTVVALPNAYDAVHASATWSSADQVYFVTWMQSGNSTSVGLANGRSVFGYFMNGDLTSADGVNASYALSETSTAGWNGLVKHEYSPTLDQWALIWAKSNEQAKVRLTLVSYASGVVTAPPSTVVVDASTELGYDSYQMSGDVIWIAPLNTWLVSWGGVPVSGDPWGAYARTVAPDGTLGDPFSTSNFGNTRHGSEVTWMNSHQMYFDAATGLIYASGSAESNDPVENDNLQTAVMWTFSLDGPVEWWSLIAPREEGGVDMMLSSSRATISGNNGAVAVAYQNWPNGDWDDPAEVRFYLASGADLADTGTGIVPNALVIALLITGVGVVAVSATRRRTVS
jgi:hypothetical protein